MDLLFLSKRIYLGTEDGFIHGGIIVNNEGIIQKVLKSAGEVNTYLYNIESEAVCFQTKYFNYIHCYIFNFYFYYLKVYDFENLVLMPGLIDVNVHINEPGRKDWEGFVTATKAAAAGGFTTIIDRPT